MDEVVSIIMSMFEQNVQEPDLFIEALRQYHEANTAQRGDLANALSELIIRKRVDLAQVRQLLLHEEEHALMSTLDALLDLIEPYIEEGGVDE